MDKAMSQLRHRPLPPPVFVATSAFTPSSEQHGCQFLDIDVGDRFGEVKTFDQKELWLYVVRVGGHPHGKEEGWVSKELLTPHHANTEPPVACIDVEMRVHPSPAFSPFLGDFHCPSPTFNPFLGDWKMCLKLLHGISGLWKDDRGRKAKTYKLTWFPEEGCANVLTELPCGGFRQGKGLVKIRKVAYNVFAIFWSENFVLNSEACGMSLQWLPICEKSHSTWTWRKKFS